MNSQELIAQLNWRYATKAFDPSKKISDVDWKALEDSLLLAPSSYGLQPWKFLVISNPAIREKLRGHSWGQSQVTDASHFVVFLGRTEIKKEDVTRFIDRMVEVQGVARENLAGYEALILNDVVDGPRNAWGAEWAARQTYIAAGFFMSAAASLQIDTCPLEGLDPQGYDEVLGLKDSGYRTLMACAAGYRSEKDSSASAKKFATKKIR